VPSFLYRISARVHREAEDAVSELLTALCQQTATAYSPHETNLSIVSVFCLPGQKPAKSTLAAARAGLETIHANGLKTAPGTMSVARIRRENWAESWKRHFKPLRIGKSLLIKPSWNRQRPLPGQHAVILDPGLSFGTGHHPTTAFCLEQAVLCHKTGQKSSFLDIGTGSGILAIAAAKLGYAPVHAFDYDADAIRIARENAHRNRANKLIRFARQDLASAPMVPNCTYDLICANLEYDSLLRFRQQIANRLSPGGTLVLAGILKSQFDQVHAAYLHTGMKMVKTKALKEWKSGAFKWARPSAMQGIQTKILNAAQV
jgi:ribosomal protein L11 methyltransferase